MLAALCKCSVEATCAGCSAYALCASCSAQVLVELSGSALHTSFLLEKFHYEAAAVELYAEYNVCAEKLRFLSRKAAADQAGIEPATVRLSEQPRKPRDNFQRPVRKQQIRTAPQRECFDTHDPSRGFIGHFANSRGAAATALRPRGSAHRVAREC